MKICNKEVQFVDSFTYLGSLITNDGSSSRDVTSRIAKAASAKCRLSNPLFRKHRFGIRTKVNMYRALVVSVLLYGSESWSTTLADCRRSDVFDMCCHRRLLRVFGSSTSATEASMNAPSNQPHHLSYDNAAYAGSDISNACHPPSLYEGSMTSNQTFMAGKDQDVTPKLDGLIPSSNSAGLDTTYAAQMEFDRPQWKAFVSGLPMLEPEQGS